MCTVAAAAAAAAGVIPATLHVQSVPPIQFDFNKADDSTAQAIVIIMRPLILPKNERKKNRRFQKPISVIKTFTQQENKTVCVWNAQKGSKDVKRSVAYTLCRSFSAQN